MQPSLQERLAPAANKCTPTSGHWTREISCVGGSAPHCFPPPLLNSLFTGCWGFLGTALGISSGSPQWEALEAFRAGPCKRPLA